MLNEALNVVEACAFEVQGEVVQLKEMLGVDRPWSSAPTRSDRADRRAASNRHPGPATRCCWTCAPGSCSSTCPSRRSELILEEVPDISYQDIGGLADQIEQIRDAVELPFPHADLFAEHQLKPPKGILLYGPRAAARP